MEKIWMSHQNRRINAGKELWALLVLLLWARDTGIGAAARPGQHDRCSDEAATV